MKYIYGYFTATAGGNASDLRKNFGYVPFGQDLFDAGQRAAWRAEISGAEMDCVQKNQRDTLMRRCFLVDRSLFCLRLVREGRTRRYSQATALITATNLDCLG